MKISKSFAALENPIPRTCMRCGIGFLQKTSKLARFCSRKCGALAYKKAHYVSRQSIRARFFKCGNCGKDVWRRPSWIKRGKKTAFCSKQCNIEFMKAKAFKMNCVICTKTFFTQPSQIKHRNRQTCSVACRSKMKTQIAEQKRIDNPPTPGLLNRRIRYSKKMRDWRKAVFERDNYTCQMCNVRGTYLQADHIKQFAYFPELRFELSNGRTLCRDCHKKTETYGYKKKDAERLRNLKKEIRQSFFGMDPIAVCR